MAKILDKFQIPYLFFLHWMTLGDILLGIFGQRFSEGLVGENFLSLLYKFLQERGNKQMNFDYRHACKLFHTVNPEIMKNREHCNF